MVGLVSATFSMSYGALKRALPDSVQRQLRTLRRIVTDAPTRPGYALSRMALAGELIAAIAPPKRPPILLISLPRSGSSWIGRILGLSERALYLREPLTQSYLDRIGEGASFFEIGMCKDRQAYERFASLAFKGIPRFEREIVPYCERWTLSGRRQKKIVVKEVNPLVIDRLWEAFRPKIIFLLRHPAPVARSFHALGWVGDQFATPFGRETLAALEREYVVPRAAAYWEQSGAFQAILQHRVMSVLARGDHVVARYEDVCEDPLGEFAKIFDFCDLPLSPAIRREIARSSQSGSEYVPGQYDTTRNSRCMKERWKTEMGRQEIELVRRGYFANRPIFYGDEGDW